MQVKFTCSFCISNFDSVRIDQPSDKSVCSNHEDMVGYVYHTEYSKGDIVITYVLKT